MNSDLGVRFWDHRYGNCPKELKLAEKVPTRLRSEGFRVGHSHFPPCQAVLPSPCFLYLFHLDLKHKQKLGHKPQETRFPWSLWGHKVEERLWKRPQEGTNCYSCERWGWTGNQGYSLQNPGVSSALLPQAV